MSCCVLDCSVAAAWVLPGEPTADALLDDVAAAGATVPGLWPLEIANALLVAVRRDRITLAERHQALTFLTDLPLYIEPQTATHVWTETLRLAEAQDLSVYDASYLDIAIRLGLPLASRDKKLRRAARDCGIGVLG